ncbi:MAG: hypothetical protein ACTHKY_19235 [Ginsengibacter sp.]
MEQYSELINVLNDLIYINKDRVRELNKRITDLGNDFKYSRLLEQLIKQSLEFTDQLIHEVEKKGGVVINKVTGNTGAIFNSWEKLRSWLLKKKNLSVLEMLQYNTKAALKVYNEALFVVANIPADTLDLIATQKARIRECCKIIENKVIHNNNFEQLY